MNPFLTACLILLALVLGLALAGMLLTRLHVIRVRSAAHYTRLCTVLVLGGFYAMTVYRWPGLHLRELDFWSVMVILAIVSYAAIWGAVAYQINRTQQPEFGESFMLSMLYTDSQQHPQSDFEPTQVADKKPRR